MSTRIVFGSAFVGLLSAAGPAMGERAAVVSLGGDGAIAETARREVISKVGEMLRSEGIDLMPAAEAARRRAALRCEARDCEQRLRAALAVDLLVTVGLWAGSSAQDVRGLVIGLVREASYFGHAEVGEAGIAAAIGEALAEARSREALGPGPWLRVEGEPRGALVVLDGTDWGVLPHEAAVPAGTHRVLVRLEGYVSEERTITSTADSPEPVTLAVRLARRQQSQHGRTPSRVDHQRPARPQTHVVVDRPVVGPVVLGATGLVGVGIAIGGLLTTSCELEHDGRCRVGIVADETWVLSYGLGGAAAIGAALAWHLMAGVPRSEPVVGVGPGSVYIRGAF